jgi:hypothetical protein
MTTRRNPFDNPSTVSTQAIPPDIYEALRTAEPRKRNRRWEKQHQSHKAVYRGVDPKLALQIKSIAAELLVPEGEVARAVIEHALRNYELGGLELRPRPNPYRMRMTLFPSSDSTHFSDKPVKPTRPAKQKRNEALWKVITTWRGFPPELKRELADLASDDGLNVPVGELITALLRFGLKNYERGLLTLEPIQKRTTFTLALEGNP